MPQGFIQKKMKELDKKNIEDILSLTPMQEGMLFHYLKDRQRDSYFEQLSLRISGEIDTGIFEKAWHLVVVHNLWLMTTVYGNYSWNVHLNLG